MLGISTSHLIILALVLVIFGPRKIPEIARKLGRTVKQFRDGIQGVTEADFRRVDPKSPPPPQQGQTETSDPKTHHRAPNDSDV